MNTMARRRWLFVGASGRVGSLLRASWDKAPADQLEIIFQRREFSPHYAGDFIWAPLEGPQPLVDRVENSGGFEGMMMFAGGPKDADPDVHAKLAEACLSAAMLAGVGRVLVASSSAVYGRGRGEPLRETDPVAPVNAYGRAKLAQEAVCRKYRDAGMSVTCLRIGNVAGADALLASTDTPVLLDRFADGNGPVRSYAGPETFARALSDLAAAPVDLPEILNFGAPKPVAMADLLDAAGRSWQWRQAPPDALQSVVLDCALLERHITFLPKDSDAAEIVAQAGILIR